MSQGGLRLQPVAVTAYVSQQTSPLHRGMRFNSERSHRDTTIRALREATIFGSGRDKLDHVAAPDLYSCGRSRRSTGNARGSRQIHNCAPNASRFSPIRADLFCWRDRSFARRAGCSPLRARKTLRYGGSASEALAALASISSLRASIPGCQHFTWNG